MTKFDPRELRKAFGSFLTGVTVVTTTDKNGVPVGFTANSFTSVSITPPLLLVCPSKSLSSIDVFKSQEHFAINILGNDQQDISNIFAASHPDRFGATKWSLSKYQNPIFQEVSAWFDCVRIQLVDAGDHWIFIGEVNDYDYFDKDGLGFSKHGYFNLDLHRQAAELQSNAVPINVGLIIEHEGAVLMVREENRGTLNLPIARKPTKATSQQTLQAKLAASNILVEFGPIYSIFEDTTTGEYSLFYRATLIPKSKPKNVELLSLDNFPFDYLENMAAREMMVRFVREYKARHFGVYVGTEHQGDVQMLETP